MSAEPAMRSVGYDRLSLPLPASAARLMAAFPAPYNDSSWLAKLELGIEQVGPRSVVARRRHSGPLIVQKPFYPEGEGCVHLVIVHPPGGIADGDRLMLDTDVGAGAHALLTTPGAAKWYKCPLGTAEQRISFRVDAGGVLEWLPQETILFDATRARLSTEVNLAADASYAGWDIVCFGRTAAAERFGNGELRQRTVIHRGGQTIWLETGRLAGGDALLDSPLGLAGYPVCGTFVMVGPKLADVPLAQLRAISPAQTARHGITLLPETLVARYLGDSAEQARHYFESLWVIARPVLCGREACAPRIWKT